MEKVRFAVFTIQRLENEFLDEFICYYLTLGFEKIYIYDNSRDGDESILPIVEKYGDKVFVYKWEGDLIAAHKHFNENFTDKMEWLLVIDVDELLEFRDVDNIKDFVESFPDVKVHGFVMKFFETSGFQDQPKGLNLDNFIWCRGALANIIKTLIKIDEFKKSELLADCHLRVRNVRIDENTLCDYPTLGYTKHHSTYSGFINHYITRSLNTLISKKIYRGSGLAGSSSDEDYRKLWSDRIEKLRDPFSGHNRGLVFDTSFRDKMSLKVKKTMEKYSVDLGLYKKGNLESLNKSYYYSDDVVKKFHGNISPEEIEYLFENEKLIYSEAQNVLTSLNYEKYKTDYPDKINWIIKDHKKYIFDISSVLPKDFDPEEYVKIHKDLDEVSKNYDKALFGTFHFLCYAISEKRIYKLDLPENFTAEAYRELNPDLKNLSDLEIKKHYIIIGSVEKRSYKK